MIAIIDYKMGNLASVKNMLKKVGCDSVITSDPDRISEASKLIFPGVGSFDAGMKNLNQMGLVPVLKKKALEDNVPVLGICLGMQLITESSEEGSMKGLGWIKAKTVKFNFNGNPKKLKIPHMGWNTVMVAKSSGLFRGLKEQAKFYFVHSYHLVCEDAEDILTTTNHGYDFVSSVQKGNIMGVQFHPEKSHRFGMQLLKNFATLDLYA